MLSLREHSSYTILNLALKYSHSQIILLIDFYYMELLIIFVLILINGAFFNVRNCTCLARKARLNLLWCWDSNAKIALYANEPNRFYLQFRIGITLIEFNRYFSGEKMTTDIKEFYGQSELIASSA